jgi:hypothetical protein
VDCAVPTVSAQARRLLEPFAVSGWPDTFGATVGTIRHYDQNEVLRHLSPGARRVAQAGSPTAEMMELYEDGERFWVVDERWGMAEVNLLKGQWRSWLLPRPQLDAVRCCELAVLWPVAQLLRAKGLYLLPAVSAVRDGWSVLILSPFGMEPELTALIRAGYRIIGQRWTAVREEDGRLALLHVPGQVERPVGPRLRSTLAPAPAGGDARGPDDAGWVDLTAEYPGSWQNHAFCDAVLVIEPGRRPAAQTREAADPSAALSALRTAWPMVELMPQRRYGQLALKLAQNCRCCEVQLSRNPKDLLTLLNALRYAPAGGAGKAIAATPSDLELALTPWASMKPPTGVAA